jgi:hypothetical protein
VASRTATATAVTAAIAAPPASRVRQGEDALDALASERSNIAACLVPSRVFQLRTVVAKPMFVETRGGHARARGAIC